MSVCVINHLKNHKITIIMTRNDSVRKNEKNNYLATFLNIKQMS